MLGRAVFCSCKSLSRLLHLPVRGSLGTNRGACKFCSRWCNASACQHHSGIYIHKSAMNSCIHEKRTITRAHSHTHKTRSCTHQACACCRGKTLRCKSNVCSHSNRPQRHPSTLASLPSIAPHSNPGARTGAVRSVQLSRGHPRTRELSAVTQNQGMHACHLRARTHRHLPTGSLEHTSQQNAGTA